MKFVNYAIQITPNLKNTPSVLLQATDSTLYVNSITICNMSLNNIRFNLQMVTTGSDGSSVSGFVLQNLDIPVKTDLDKNSKSTINLVSAFGLEIFLPVTITSEVTYKTKLMGFSNGVQQTFDSTITYTSFVETANYS